MKILFITTDFYPRIGGGENYILNLAKELSKTNEIFVLCPDELDSGIKNISSLNIYYLPFYKLFDNKFIKPLIIYKNIKNINSDIIYSVGPSIMDFFAIFFAKILRKKIVITYHADLNLNKLSSKIFTKLYFLFCLPLYNKIIVTSEKFKKILINRGIKENKIFVIPVGFENRTKDYNFKKNNDIVQILFVGALDSQHLYKNIETLIHSINYLDKNKFRLNIVGDGDLRNKYQELAKNLNLKNINFLGKLHDQELIIQYKNADIFILPSNTQQEGFGIVLLEALSFGCKIITGENCGGAFIIKENPEFGILYNGTDRDLEKKINIVLFYNIPLYKTRNFLKYYEWNKIGKDILNIIQNFD